jgi:hypothetical protein
MGKEKEPKPLYRYDPAKDRLNHIVHLEERSKKPSMGELILALKVASCANEFSGCKAWGIDSLFQKKIESLVGPRPYGDEYKKEDTKDVKSPIGESEVL